MKLVSIVITWDMLESTVNFILAPAVSIMPLITSKTDVPFITVSIPLVLPCHSLPHPTNPTCLPDSYALYHPL